MMKPEVKEKWEEFMSGKWSQEKPSRPGRYICVGTASLQNVSLAENGEIIPLIEDFNRKLKWQGLHDHRHGWWWSIPLPEMQPCTG